MKIVSNNILGRSIAAGAMLAAVGIGAHHAAIDIQAAPATPVHVSPPPPSPPPPPPSTAESYVPGNPDPNPGAEGGGGGGGGG